MIFSLNTAYECRTSITPEDFLSSDQAAWEAGEKECGAYVEHGDWTMEAKNDGTSLTSEAKLKTEMQTLSSVFDENGNWRVWMFLLIIQQERSWKKPD